MDGGRSFSDLRVVSVLRLAFTLQKRNTSSDMTALFLQYVPMSTRNHVHSLHKSNPLNGGGPSQAPTLYIRLGSAEFPQS